MSEEQNQAAEDDPFDDTDVASMEDILASIRSMIAEDPEPPKVQPAPPPIGENVDLSPLEEDFDIESLMEPIEDMPAPKAPEPIEAAKVDPPAPEPADLPEDALSLDALFEDVDLQMAPDVEPLKGEGRHVGESEDMDLVKSLMADLTEDPELEATAELSKSDDALELSSDWFVEDLAIPEIAPEDSRAVSEPSDLSEGSREVPAEGDILDDILEQSLRDEEALAEADLGPALESGSAAVALAAGAQSDEVPQSLAELAARAERDAKALSGQEASPEDEPEAASAKVEDITAAEAAQDLPAPEATADLYQALEEDVMARNAPLEEIVADEVETEAGSAFAELNRLVEEKNVYEEQGPRIGDLVQEALKPMLKEWLDENLKGIVERAVAKEVKRISSGK